MNLKRNIGNLYKLCWAVVNREGEVTPQYERVGAEIHYREFESVKLPVGGWVGVFLTDDWLDNGQANGASALLGVRINSPEDKFELSYTRSLTIAEEVTPPEESPELLTVERNGMQFTASDGSVTPYIQVE